MFNGDWESGNLGKQMPDAGFFLMPPATAGGKHVAMSAPLTYGIGAKAKHPDCAAFFANWVATNKAARKIDVAVGGSNPGGPTNLTIPKVPIPLISQTLAAGKVIAKDNGATDFIANATGGIFAAGWTPQLQEMVGGQQTGAGMLKAVQAEYEKELAG
jgi:raffinose/stachyose/melibiose transport system substrate-binding protein